MRLALVSGSNGGGKVMMDMGTCCRKCVSLKVKAHCDSSQVERRTNLCLLSPSFQGSTFLEQKQDVNLPYLIALYVFRFNFHVMKIVLFHYHLCLKLFY